MKSRDVISVNLVFTLTVLVYLLASVAVSFFSEQIPFWLLLVVSQASLLVVPAVYAIRSGKVRERTGIHKISGGTAVLTVLLILCMEPVLTFLNALSQCFVDTPTTSMIIDASSTYPFPVMFLIVALMPAICEEFVYRGVFFHTYKEEAVVPGAVLSGLLFGIMHGNLNQFVYAFFMGFAFSMTVYATGTLCSSMIMHLVVNGLSTVLLYVIPLMNNPELAEMMTETGEKMTVSSVLKTYTFPAVIGLALSVYVYQAIAKRCGKWDDIRDAFRAKGKTRAFRRLITLPLAGCILLMTGLMVLAEFT